MLWFPVWCLCYGFGPYSYGPIWLWFLLGVSASSSDLGAGSYGLYIVIAFIAMAFTVMVHIVMVCIVMAYIVMVHIVMAHIVMAHIGMAHIVMTHIV